MAEKKKTELPLGNIADILAVQDIKEKMVEVPEWGCSVKIKALTKADQIRVRKMSVQGNQVDAEKMEGFMFLYGVVEPKFEPEHLDRLFDKSSGAVDKILAEILSISGMTDEDAEDAKTTFQN